MIQFAINKAYFLQALHTTRRAISSNVRVTSGKLETTLMKKFASKRILPGCVINKPAFSSEAEMLFSIEICPFEPVK